MQVLHPFIILRNFKKQKKKENISYDISVFLKSTKKKKKLNIFYKGWGGYNNKMIRQKSRKMDLRELSHWGSRNAKIFERQEALFNYIDRKKDKELKTFSVESAESLVERMRKGAEVNLFEDPEKERDRVLIPQKRFFMAATYRDVYRYLFDIDDENDFTESSTSGIAPVAASVYEIIREGTPCNLYFDIEVEYNKVDATPATDVELSQATYSKAIEEGIINPPVTEEVPLTQCDLSCTTEFNSQHLTDILLRELNIEFNSVYDITIHRENMVKLVSNYTHKYSAHYVVHLPEAVFKNNQHQGRFLTSFVQRLYEKAHIDNELHEALFYHKIDDDVSAARSFCQNEVSQQLHRRISRGKIHFNRSLTPVIDLAVYTRNRTFRCMSASKLGKNSFLYIDPNDCSFPYFTDNDLFLASLVANCSEKVSEGARILEFGTDNVKQNLPKAIGTGLGNSNNDGRASTGQSAYVMLDNFIKKLLRNKPYGTGYVTRHIVYDTTILYVVGGSKHCENVGREHKSNGIYLVVNLITMTVKQKCYDHDCHGFSSKEIPLDPQLISSILELQSQKYASYDKSNQPKLEQPFISDDSLSKEEAVAKAISLNGKKAERNSEYQQLVQFRQQQAETDQLKKKEAIDRVLNINKQKLASNSDYQNLLQYRKELSEREVKREAIKRALAANDKRKVESRAYQDLMEYRNEIKRQKLKDIPTCASAVAVETLPINIRPQNAELKMLVRRPTTRFRDNTNDDPWGESNTQKSFGFPSQSLGSSRNITPSSSHVACTNIVPPISQQPDSRLQESNSQQLVNSSNSRSAIPSTDHSVCKPLNSSLEEHHDIISNSENSDIHLQKLTNQTTIVLQQQIQEGVLSSPLKEIPTEDSTNDDHSIVVRESEDTNRNSNDRNGGSDSDSSSSSSSNSTSELSSQRKKLNFAPLKVSMKLSHRRK